MTYLVLLHFKIVFSIYVSYQMKLVAAFIVKYAR